MPSPYAQNIAQLIQQQGQLAAQQAQVAGQNQAGYAKVLGATIGDIVNYHRQAPERALQALQLQDAQATLLDRKTARADAQAEKDQLKALYAKGEPTYDQLLPVVGPERAATIIKGHQALKGEPFTLHEGDVRFNGDNTVAAQGPDKPPPPPTTASLAVKAAGGDTDAAKALELTRPPVQPPKVSFQSKSVLLDGKPTEVSYDPTTGRYVLPAAPIDRSAWDPRPDGTTKGDGFLGVLKRPDGGVMSEYSIADSEKLKDAQGHYLDYPSLVPTLTPSEVQTLLKSKPGDAVPQSIKDKAEAYALQRVKQGKSVFAEPGEANTQIFAQIPRADQPQDVTSRVRPIPPAAGNANQNPPGDWNVTGDDFLKTIPPQWRRTVEKISHYEEDPTKVASMRGGMRETLTQWVNQVNPTYDQSSFAIRNPTRKAYTTGTQGQQITSMNTAIEHLDMLQTAADALQNGNFKPGNAAYNAWKDTFGSAPPSNYQTIKGMVDKEVEAVANKGVPTVSGTAEQKALAGQAASPGQIKGYIDTLIPLMGSKLHALDYTYRQAMGADDPFKPLTPRAEQILAKRGFNPTDPTIGGTPAQTADISVTAPNGKTYSFKSQADADAFKAKAGLK